MRKTVYVRCTHPGCDALRRTTKSHAANVKYCLRHQDLHSRQTTFAKHNRYWIIRIHQMRKDGHTPEEIGEALDRNINYIRTCLRSPVLRDLDYKVIKASYWIEGIYMDADILEREFLRPGCFDPQAILEREGKRFRVVRRGERQELVPCG